MNRVAEEIMSYYGVASDPSLQHYGTKRHSGRYPWGSGENPYQGLDNFRGRVAYLRSNGFSNGEIAGALGISEGEIDIYEQQADQGDETRENSGASGYGVKLRKGDYPWSGENAKYSSISEWNEEVKKLRESGKTEKDISKEFGITTKELRVYETRAKHLAKQEEYEHIKSLKDAGYSNAEIAREIGKNESTVRSILDDSRALRLYRADNTADKLREELKTKKMVDIGAGAELTLGVSNDTLDEAVLVLEMEGYKHYGVGMKYATDRTRQINMDILCQPDVEYAYAYKNPGEIREIGEYHTDDSGLTWSKREYPASLDSSRVHIRYNEEGGNDMDGTIEIRRGVKDLDLGNSHYAQVRILVDGTHYMKGMAVYSDDIPDGVDIVYNTNKTVGTPKEEVFKKIKTDTSDPFGGVYIKANGQSWYEGDDGEKHLSPINKLKEEGDYETQSKTLSSQFLSKQPTQLIKSQLDITYKDYEAQYKEISSLTNPALKQKLLMDFADECDTATCHMKAVAFPRQQQQVLLPVPELKDNEIYAPNYNTGDTVVLVRYPHGGTFELPVLTVNNNQPDAKRRMAGYSDAVGINKKVADQLSGADFDGDTVTVIPLSDRVRITARKPLEGLKNFDPKTDYYVPEELRRSKENKKGIPMMTKDQTQKEMGKISNLITDMTLQGATDEELERAVKHSMVVIDAEKHKLDYKRSEKENRISELKAKYQPKYTEDGELIFDKHGKPVGGGAATLISRRKQEVDVPERKGSPIINKETGEVTYKTTDRYFTDPKTGQERQATQKSPLLLETEDLRTLSSGTKQENLYADHGNKLKALAAKARIEAVNTPNATYNKDAKDLYSVEVAHINEMLKEAALNKPRERRAQALANSRINALKEEYPVLKEKSSAKQLRKISQQEIEKARAEVGASGKLTRITLSDREWEAIQAGAISHSRMKELFEVCEPTALRTRALPRSSTQLSPAKVNRIKSLAATNNYTRAEIANMLGISISTVSEYMAS